MSGQELGARGSGLGYQGLRAWKEAHGLALASYRLSERLRQHHRWLATQLVRASVSVPANIAEGYHRGSPREYIYFLTIARGSLAETEYYVLFALEAGLVDTGQAQELQSHVSSAASLLQGLIRSLEAKHPRRQPRIGEEPSVYATDASEGPPIMNLVPSPEPPVPPEVP